MHRVRHSEIYKMRRERGFKIKNKLVVKLYKWITTRPGRRRTRIRRAIRERSTANPITKVLNLARCLREKAYKKLKCSFKPLGQSKSGYFQLGQEDPVWEKRAEIPKGHLAVYVGESQDEAQRYLVPVIYFNHPLFGELLKEAERVYGFSQPGRITIPCGASEFEKVQMRIASADRDHFLQRRRFEQGQYWL